METSIFRDTLVYTLLMKVKLLIREYNIHKQTNTGNKKKPWKLHSFFIRTLVLIEKTSKNVIKMRTNGLPKKNIKILFEPN